MFKVGDLAVYPAYGVGRVISIEERVVSGEKHTFYVIQILKKGMKVMVPRNNASGKGLRDIVSKKEANAVFKVLRERNVKLNNQNWTKRFKEYQDKIKTGSVKEIAEVLRDIHLLSLKKDLSFGEKKILETARELLVEELAIALSKTEDEIRKKIDKCLTD